ncbi:UDP-glucose/GDP-mannose dehydrogenase family protein [Chitinibacter sp. SCUT-21]|uniref:UDP-glucose dehydrogenase family protein n=1 Tax=Chitinibacter sp. SCUT-21 TaxID=2970891 RepID=UPI0035A72D4D
MRITVIGSGYVGLVTGACLAEFGNQVLCLDLDVEITTQLQQGHIPIYEPGLDELIRRNLQAGRLQFTCDIGASVAHGTIQFIAVGTPSDEDGSADLQYVLAAASNIGRYLNEYKVIVNKSTVPVGTADLVRQTVQQQLDLRGQRSSFSVVSNPEFLKEGAAVDDFMRPDRIVIGAEDETAKDLMQAIYAPLVRNHDRILNMDLRSAELTKYAANAMLATRISFMNELANLAEVLGADIELVRKGIGSDPRIGYHFLYPGVGYGGSCFPKDVQALQRTALELGEPLKILQAVHEVNGLQKQILLDKIIAHFGPDLRGFHFAVWGLAFKPDTDDLREAPSLVLITGLLARGATVTAYDPVANAKAAQYFAGHPACRFAEQALDALNEAHALLIITEWKAFRSPDFAEMKQRLRKPIIFDGRNLYDPKRMKAEGFAYYPIGREQIEFPISSTHHHLATQLATVV